MTSFAPHPPTCEGCPANHLGLSYVPPSGPIQSPVVMLGQGPGRTEAEGFWNKATQREERAPFIGRSGYKLDEWMQRAGWPSDWRQRVRLDNTVRCWLRKGNKDVEPTAAMVSHCRRVHWGPELAACPRTLVIAVGVAAIKATYGSWAGERTAGSLIEWKDHP